jgi:tRNA U34 5-carboxymethylaminomethyl modifying enzyme MnmG/GidA
MQDLILNYPNLQVMEGSVEDLEIDNSQVVPQVQGIRLGTSYFATYLIA